MHTFITDLCYFFLLVNSILFTYSFIRNYTSKVLLYLFLYTAVMMLNQLVIGYLRSNGVNNLWLSHVYFLVQFVTISLAFRQLQTNLFIRKLNSVLLITIPVTVGAILAITPGAFKNFNIPETLLCSIPLIAYCVHHLIQAIDGNQSKLILFSIGLFVYLVSSTLVFVSAKIIVDDYLGQGFITQLWIINNIIYLSYQILIVIEWYKNFRRTS